MRTSHFLLRPSKRIKICEPLVRAAPVRQNLRYRLTRVITPIQRTRAIAPSTAHLLPYVPRVKLATRQRPRSISWLGSNHGKGTRPESWQHWPLHLVLRTIKTTGMRMLARELMSQHRILVRNNEKEIIQHQDRYSNNAAIIGRTSSWITRGWSTSSA